MANNATLGGFQTKILEEIKTVLDRSNSIDAINPLISAVDQKPQGQSLNDTAIGIDTNILLNLSNSSRAADVFDYLGSQHNPPLVLPGQAIQEFWNNQLSAVETIGDRLRKSFQKFSEDIQKYKGDFGEHLTPISEILDAFDEEHGHLYDQTTIRKTLGFLETLRDKSVIPFVPRTLFQEICEIRYTTKTPPGFKDQGDGDFYIWADFLYGLKLAQKSGDKFSRVVLVTDDRKPDWSRKGIAHPILVSEVQALLNTPFETWSYRTLIENVDSVINPKNTMPDQHADK